MEIRSPSAIAVVIVLGGGIWGVLAIAVVLVARQRRGRDRDDRN